MTTHTHPSEGGRGPPCANAWPLNISGDLWFSSSTPDRSLPGMSTSCLPSPTSPLPCSLSLPGEWEHILFWACLFSLAQVWNLVILASKVFIQFLFKLYYKKWEQSCSFFLFILGDKLFPFQRLTEMHLGCLQALLSRAILASLLKPVLASSSVPGEPKSLTSCYQGIGYAS